MAEVNCDIAVIGAGPAGMSAGIYAARSGAKCVILEGMSAGQLTMADSIENYPGFASPVSGLEILSAMRRQAESQGAEFAMDEIDRVDFSAQDKKLGGMAGLYTARAVVVATGAKARWLGIPGEKELRGRGVSACATCDGAFFRNKKVVVVGGGDSALSEALYLSGIASKVVLVHRRDSFRAAAILQKRVREASNIECLTGVAPVAFEGENGRLARVVLSNGAGVDADGAFVAIGHDPATGFLAGAVALDAAGYVRTDGRGRTDAAGVFAAGDCADARYRQAIVAAGSGAAAAMEALDYLQEERGGV